MRVRYISIQNRFSAAFCELRFVSFKSPSLSKQSNNYLFFQFNDHHQSKKRVEILANCGIPIPLFFFQSRISFVHPKKIRFLYGSLKVIYLIICFFVSSLLLFLCYRNTGISKIKNYDFSLFVHQQQQLFLSQQLEERQLHGKQISPEPMYKKLSYEYPLFLTYEKHTIYIIKPPALTIILFVHK